MAEGDAPVCITCGKPARRKATGGWSLYCDDPKGTCRRAASRARKHTGATGRSPQALVTDDAERAAQEVLREELRPAIREAITEEVLEGIRALIGAVDPAIDAAIGLLESEDDNVRLGAARLILQHTTGNRAVVPDVNEGAKNDLTILFNLPRPEGTGFHGGVEAPQDTKECDSCHKHKAHDQFVGTSNRCQECFNKMQASVEALAGANGSGPVPA